MPGCRRNDAAETRPFSLPVPRGRVHLARYVRLHARPPRAANDNRGRVGRVWHLTLLASAIPALGLLAALSALI